jgi:hypothetical protein
MSAEPITVIFLHLLKTAGTTLHRIIERNYRPDEIFSTDRRGGETFAAVAEFRALPERELRRIRMLKGHMGFGLHEYLPQPATYFTFLRDPHARLLSHLGFIAESHEHPAHGRLVAGDITFTDLLREGYEPLLDNCQVRLLSGVWNDVPFGEIGEREYRAADQHLRRHFSVVGLTRHFDAGLLLLQDAFGWRSITYTRHNVARRRLRWEDLDETARELAHHRNRWDQKLYATAVELFEAQVAAQGPSFSRRLAAFRRRQQWMRHIHRLRWQIKRISVREMIGHPRKNE